MAHGSLTIEHLVEKIEKYNAQKDKENGNMKLNLILFASGALAFVLLGIGEDLDFHMIQEDFISLLPYIAIGGAALGGIGLVKNILRKARLDKLLSALERYLIEISNGKSETNEKGMSK
ncbi:MAG: hypothetical protein FWC91_13875 [Defluviitaleaceae bacterium]|nr:hypothetical protein [Defluviitaleaceae bacterium]